MPSLETTDFGVELTCLTRLEFMLLSFFYGDDFLFFLRKLTFALFSRERFTTV